MKYTIEYNPDRLTLEDGTKYCYTLRVYLQDICIFIGLFKNIDECTTKIKEFIY